MKPISVTLKEPLSERKYSQYATLKKLTNGKHSLEVKPKERVVIFDGLVMIPFENVISITWEADDK